jgi:hypothetical protein
VVSGEGLVCRWCFVWRPLRGRRRDAAPDRRSPGERRLTVRAAALAVVVGAGTVAAYRAGLLRTGDTTAGAAVQAPTAAAPDRPSASPRDAAADRPSADSVVGRADSAGDAPADSAPSIAAVEGATDGRRPGRPDPLGDPAEARP